jgi:hypothetical protein
MFLCSMKSPSPAANPDYSVWAATEEQASPIAGK